MSSSKVLPLTDLPVSNECEFDLIEFLPTQAHWLAFLKCLAEDNVDDLKVFSKHVDWKSFLQSRDVTNIWRDCPKDFTRPSAFVDQKHPYPTNPFFVAMFYDAQKCLLFMAESGVDFSTLTERGLSAYHILMSAICFMSFRRCHNAPKAANYMGLICLFHRTLFTREQQSAMLKTVSHYGMSPLSWGVYLGLADKVEYILYYYSPNCTLHSKSVGINEHITMDVTEAVGENPGFFTSPICVMLDKYGESTLPELKQLDIFRNGFLWKQWIDVLYNRNRAMILGYLVLAIVLTLITIIFTGSSGNDYLKNKCAKSPYVYPTGTVATLITWLVTSLVALFFAVYGVVRKEYYRKKVGYPKHPRQNYKDLAGWLMPNIVALPISAFLLWIYVDADRSCSLFKNLIYTISSLCHIFLLLACVSLIVAYLRLVPALTTLMSSFYNSLGSFGIFIIFYLCLTVIFARMFQSSFIFSSGADSSTARSDTFPEFLSAFYQTFLVSLNIVNSTLFVPQDDRIDLNVTHLFYILFVPILFINFVVGILSSVVTQVLEHDIENTYILKLEACEFAERTFFLFHRLFRCFSGPRKIVLSICQPLSPESKLVMFCEDTLESTILQRVQ